MRFPVFVGSETPFEGTNGISLADFPDGRETTFLIGRRHLDGLTDPAGS
jgi:hypothetical protein